MAAPYATGPASSYTTAWDTIFGVGTDHPPRVVGELVAAARENAARGRGLDEERRRQSSAESDATIVSQAVVYDEAGPVG